MGSNASTSLSARLENYRTNPQYNKIKNAAADVLITRAEKLLPNLRKHIKYMEIGTPITNWRYSRNTAGAIYGSEQSVDNMYFNRLQATTPIQNLFLAGAWTFAGGMSAALMSGRETSKLALGLMDGVEVVLMTSPGELSSGTLPTNVESPAIKQAPIAGHSVVVAGTPQLSTIKAIGSNREINLSSLGKPAVLLFHAQETAEQAAAVNRFLRAQGRYKSCESLFIANIVDLRAVPKLFRGFAEKAMKESYEKAASALPPGVEPKDYVLILPDWDGSITKAFGLKDTNQAAALAILNESGNLIDIYQGEAAGANALAILENV